MSQDYRSTFRSFVQFARNIEGGLTVFCVAILGLAGLVLIQIVISMIFGVGCPKPSDDAPLGCIEFYFARYQTFFAAVLALGAAVAAVRPVYSQLDHMMRQSAALSRSIVVEAINEHRAERERLLAGMNSIIQGCQHIETREPLDARVAQDVTLVSVEELISDLRVLATRYPSPSPLKEARFLLQTAAQSTKATLEIYEPGAAGDGSLPLAAVTAARRHFTQYRDSYLPTLESEIAVLSAEAQRLELQARGQLISNPKDPPAFKVQPGLVSGKRSIAPVPG